MIITIFNQKGGVGKTTIACNLAVCGVMKGKSVLLIDADTQASSVDFHKLRSLQPELLDFPVVSVLTPTFQKDLRRFNHELILIDAGGRDTGISRSAILASDVVLVPLKPSGLDVWATEELLGLFQEIRQVNTRLQVIGMLNMVPGRSKIMPEVRKSLQEHEENGDILFLEAELHQRLEFSYTIMEGKCVIEGKDKAAQDEFWSFYDELMEVTREHSQA